MSGPKYESHDSNRMPPSRFRIADFSATKGSSGSWEVQMPFALLKAGLGGA